MSKRQKLMLVLVVLALLVCMMLYSFPAELPEFSATPTQVFIKSTATKLPAKRGFVTFWFDDGIQSIYDIAFPALSRRNWRAVLAIVADRNLAMEKFQAEGDPIMDWATVSKLATVGWEISSHSMSHSRLNTIIELEKLEKEIAGSRVTLNEKGFEVPSFTFPYGEQGKSVGQKVVSANYLYWRSRVSAINPVPAWRHLTAYFVTEDTNEKVVKEWIVKTEGVNGWLIVGFHAILDEPTNFWQQTPDQFEMILHLIENSSLEVVLPEEMFQRFGYAEGAVPQLSWPTPAPTPTPLPYFCEEDFDGGVWLKIPKIELKVQVKTAVATSDGYEFDFSQLHEFPLWLNAGLEHLPFQNIGLPGASLIIGHRTWHSRPKVFAKLDKLKPGDEIVIANQVLSLIYQVVGQEEVEPDLIWPIIIKEHEKSLESGSVLLLLTCTPYGTDWRRLIVFAKLEGVEEENG